MREKAFENKRNLLLSYKKYRDVLNEKIVFGDRMLELLDERSFNELFGDICTKDPLNFPGYAQKLSQNRKKTGSKDAVICGTGKIGGTEVVCAQLEGRFLMGSMGSAAGEKLACVIEYAREKSMPLIIIAASGGARMQEGMFSLYQMIKTSAAIQSYKESGGLYISILTHPTTGGVSASFASLGDIILAEPGALIGFAGPRVIEQTIGHKLPDGFQSAEFQLEHGFVDMIVPRGEMRRRVDSLLKLHTGGQRTKKEPVIPFSEKDPVTDLSSEKTVSDTKPYDRVLAARDKDRPKNPELIGHIFDDFTELAGDRLGREDPAIMGGIAYLSGIPVTVIAHRKGSSTDENIRCNFGMPGPEGYRKALRLMKQAERFNRPVITFIDTPGAYPGMEAEEHGQSVAIAENLAFMSRLKVPVISVVTGEGSSGGALAIGVADRVLMLENAVYSILSPEGFATILWKDSSKVKEACEVMRLTAADLLEDGIADDVIHEGGKLSKTASRYVNEFCESLRSRLTEEIETLSLLTPVELLRNRYKKYRGFDGFCDKEQI